MESFSELGKIARDVKSPVRWQMISRNKEEHKVYYVVGEVIFVIVTYYYMHRWIQTVD